MSEIDQPTTSGQTSFGQYGGAGSLNLFSVNPDIPIRDALEHSAQLRHCANRLLLDAAMEESGSHITWAALYLHEMAEALLDDAGIS
ncbi:DUF3077 domain-containing protein [Pseudomonas sp. TE3610]